MRALETFHHFYSFDHQVDNLESDDRVRISRTRRAIDLQEQELIQRALLEERQQSA